MTDAADLLTFIDASPSPYHAVANVSARLDRAGFERVADADRWAPAERAGHYLAKGGSLIAWTATPSRPDAGFRIIGAHTDSPNLRIKPQPDTGRSGLRQLGIEVYGGALRSSWLDRDLGLSGRVALRSGNGVDVALFRVGRALLRIPHLAIHLDRGVNDALTLNPQQHLSPIWGIGPIDEGGFLRFLARELDRDPSDVLSWDAMVDDVTPATFLGPGAELISAPRLDNLISCWAAAAALTSVGTDAVPPAHRCVICLFDHEEVGSESPSGAAGNLLPSTLERIVMAVGGDRETLHRALAGSLCVSADGAHATHPNYPERHDPTHLVQMNAGPVINTNSNLRYATDAISSARFKRACEIAEVPFQQFVMRSDMACGSTIGPLAAARLGVSTVDVGAAMLAMHSARETCGSADPEMLRKALGAFLHLE